MGEVGGTMTLRWEEKASISWEKPNDPGELEEGRLWDGEEELGRCGEVWGFMTGSLVLTFRHHEAPLMPSWQFPLILAPQTLSELIPWPQDERFAVFAMHIQCLHDN